MKKRGREGEQVQLMMTQRNTEVGGWDERMIKKWEEKAGGRRSMGTKRKQRWGKSPRNLKE